MNKITSVLWACILVMSVEAQNCIDKSNRTETILPKSTYKVRLVSGNSNNEGNVQIKYNGEWAGICDDDWGIADATVVCKQLGFERALRFTTASFFGPLKDSRKTVMWMDNVKCTGHETELSHCKSNGWGKHDCSRMEAAGVICKAHPPPCKDTRLENAPETRDPIKTLFSTPTKLSLSDGRNRFEGRVVVYTGGAEPIGEICGVGWGLREAMVVCKQLGMGFAQQAVQTDFFGGSRLQRVESPLPIVLSGVKCKGTEENLNDCAADPTDKIQCVSGNTARSVAGVVCINTLPDLTPDIHILQSSVYLSDVPMLYLQCAMEEDCLASTVRNEVARGYGFLTQTRRLLRFSSRIHNIGGEAFRPHAAKQSWEWHQCHMHYHSMEEFSHYDVVDSNGVKQAEGHKASFCLEDNGCAPGYYKHYACANFGDQGISPGCYDEYRHDIDCQWIDISDLKPGQYTFTLKINPSYRVAEMNYTNNAIHCDLYYSLTQALVSNCFHTSP